MTTTGHLAIRDRVPVWTIQDRLRKARESAGYTQEQLAHELDVSGKTVRRAELAGSSVRRTTVLAWALATGVDAGWLETGAELPRLDSNQQPAGYRRHLRAVS